LKLALVDLSWICLFDHLLVIERKKVMRSECQTCKLEAILM